MSDNEAIKNIVDSIDCVLEVIPSFNCMLRVHLHAARCAALRCDIDGVFAAIDDAAWSVPGGLSREAERRRSHELLRQLRRVVGANARQMPVKRDNGPKWQEYLPQTEFLRRLLSNDD